MLGRCQWEDLLAFLDGPASEYITTLFLVSSVPVAHVARWLTLMFERLPGKLGNSVRDRWTAGAYRNRRDALLDRLAAWQSGKLERQVIVLSGDVHVAGAHTIRSRQDGTKIEQFTSSAFTTPLSSYERYLNVVAARGLNLFEPEWRFVRHFISYANNVGLVRLTPLEEGGHAVEFLVRGWNRRERALHTVARYKCLPVGK